jgi:hypothetical protein
MLQQVYEKVCSTLECEGLLDIPSAMVLGSDSIGVSLVLQGLILECIVI